MRASSYAQRDCVTETRAGSTFTGVVWGEVLLPHADDSVLNRLSFAPGSRTFWHRHCGG